MEFLQNFQIPALPEYDFNTPGLLWLIPVLLLLQVVVIWLGKRVRSSRLKKLIGVQLQKHLVENISRRNTLRNLALFNAGLIFLVIALARPLLNEKEENVETLGVDVMIALDLSRSMLVEDAQMFGSMTERNQAAETEQEKVYPSRLEAAKEGIREFTNQLTGDRVGLIAFAGEARMMAPLTFDTEALELVLNAINENTLWLGGTSLTEAIKLADEKLQEKELDTRVLVVISDGEDLEGDAILAARDANIRNGLTTFTVGVGSASGARIPVRQYDGQGRLRRETFHKSRAGQEVVSRADPVLLQKLAAAGGGMYVDLGPQGQGMRTIYEQGLRPLAERLDTRKVVERVEIFQVPLAMSLFFFLMQLLVADRKRRGAEENLANAPTTPAAAGTGTDPGSGSAPAGAASAVALMVGSLALILICAFPSPARAVDLENLKIDLEKLRDDVKDVAEDFNPDLNKKAERLVRAGRAHDAFELLQAAVLKNRTDPYLLYNYAIAAAAAGELGVARTVFDQLAGSAHEKIAAKSVFQLANIQFKESWGMRDGRGHHDTRILLYEQARYNYQRAMEAGASRNLASRNLDLTEDELVRLYLEDGGQKLKQAKDSLERAGDDNEGQLQRAVDELQVAKNRFMDLRELDENHEKARESLEEVEDLLFEARLKLARQEKADLDQRMAEAKPQSPEESPVKQDDRARRDEENEFDRQMDRLLNQHDEAIAEYQDAIDTETQSQEDQQQQDLARQEQQEVRESAADLLEDNADRALAESELEERLQNQVQAMSEAQEKLEMATQYDPEDAALAAKAEAVTYALHQVLKDDSAERIANAQQEKPENMERQVSSLEQATQQIDQAMMLRPDDEELPEMREQAQELLAEAYQQRGEENMESAEETQDTNLPQAIAHAEAAVTDFELASENSEDLMEQAQGQKEEALAMLENLRTELTEQQHSEGDGEQQDGQQQQQQQMPQQQAMSDQPQQQWEDLKDLTFDQNMFSYGKAKMDTKRDEVLKDW